MTHFNSMGTKKFMSIHIMYGHYAYL